MTVLIATSDQGITANHNQLSPSFLIDVIVSDQGTTANHNQFLTVLLETQILSDQSINHHLHILNAPHYQITTPKSTPLNLFM